MLTGKKEEDMLLVRPGFWCESGKMLFVEARLRASEFIERSFWVVLA